MTAAARVGTWGFALAALRERAGFSQRELAELLGWSQATIARWERNDVAIDLVQLGLLARVYQYPSASVLVRELEALR